MRTTALLLLVCPFFCQMAESQPYTISTIAGATRLRDGMAATSAPLRDPLSVALDQNGNLYIADALDNRIHKVDNSGIITTFAGTGLPGYSGDRGPAALAQLNFPVSVTFDSKGNLFIADEGNAVIRRVSSDGTINTVAGNGNPQFAGDNGPATSAQIDPSAIAVDSQGNMYIADGANFRIRKVNTSGIITTIGGTGKAGVVTSNGRAINTQIGFITDLAVDNAGNLYIADPASLAVTKIDSAGLITIVAGDIQFGSIADGIKATTAVMAPQGVALDSSGNLYISDDNLLHTVIRRVDLSTGLIYTMAGSGEVGFTGDGGGASLAEFNSPAGLAVGANGVYIADTANHRIRRLAGNLVTTFAGTGINDLGPATAAFLNLPEGLAIDFGGNLLIADSGNNEAREFKINGTIDNFGQLYGQPAGVAVDRRGNFYVSVEEANTASPHVLEIQPGGATSIIAGAGSGGFAGDGGPAITASINFPQGLAVDDHGVVYFADWGNHRVRKIDLQGNIHTIAGNGKVQFSGDNGTATSAGMDPFGVALDSSGNVFVADRLNNRIRKIASDGTVTTVVGSGLAGYEGDGGPAAAALLNFPTGIAIDQYDNLYVADAGNSKVRRVTSTGLISTIAGNGVPTPSTGDGGPAIAAQINPFNIAVDAQSNVYVTDSLNDHVRMLKPQAVPPANMSIVSGNGQSGMAGSGLAAPLVLKIADNSGAGVPGLIVTFAVVPQGAAIIQPSPAITLNDGTVTALVTLGSYAGRVTITASSGALLNVTYTVTALALNSPAIAPGGVVSAGLSSPQVNVLSPNAIVTVFGSNFAPAGTAKTAGLVNGQLPTNLDGVCVEFGTVRAPIFALYPGQINLQVPEIAALNVTVVNGLTRVDVPVQVITACDTPQAVGSSPVTVAAQATAPEFFYFTTGGSGGHPIAAIDAVTGGYIGAPGLITGATFTPAKPGGYLTLFATGFGATNPAVDPGVLPSGNVPVTASVSIQFGGVTLAPSDILYVGLSQFAGLYQVNIRVPAGVPDGDQALIITVGGVASPSNAFVSVQTAP